MHYCKDCGSEINSEESFCLICKKNQPPIAIYEIKQPKQFTKRKLLFGILGLFTVVLIFAGAIVMLNSDSADKNSGSVLPNTETASDSEPLPAAIPTDKSFENNRDIPKTLELIQIFSDFNEGTLENLALSNQEGEKELKLEMAKLDFEKNIVADNFLSARSVHAVDIDRDGKIDILGAARYSHKIAWWKNNGFNHDTGKISFTEFTIDSDFKGAFSVHGVDVDNDNFKDIIGASLYDEQIAWWKNNQDGTFSDKKIIDNYFDGAIYVYSADIDSDGYMDILAAGEAVDQIAWWRNLGDGTFSSCLVIGDSFVGARSVHAADIDLDGDLDVLGTARFADKVAWWENLGEGEEFIEHIIDANFDGARSAHAADIDNDGDIDILGAARYSHQIALWENNGSQSFTKILIDDQFEGATNIISADLNHDGKNDIVAAAVYANRIAWWQNNGDRQFTRYLIGENFIGATFVYAEDISGDSYKDILVPAVFDHQIGLWLTVPQYMPYGTYISPVINKTANMTLKSLSWEAHVPEGTSLLIQIRSADNEGELESANWHGPLSTEEYYSVSESIINPVHNEDALIQYRVIFKTDDILISPRITELKIELQ